MDQAETCRIGSPFVGDAYSRASLSAYARLQFYFPAFQYASSTLKVFLDEEAASAVRVEQRVISVIGRPFRARAYAREQRR